MDAAVEIGGNVDFTCTATSNASLTFFWRTTASGVTLPDDVEDGSDPVAGITSTLSLTAVTVSHCGDYICDVENERGNKSSTPATLTVVGECMSFFFLKPKDPPRLKLKPSLFGRHYWTLFPL